MKEKLLAIWKIITSDGFIAITYRDARDGVWVHGRYRDEDKTDSPVVNDVIESIWKNILEEDCK